MLLKACLLITAVTATEKDNCDPALDSCSLKGEADPSTLLQTRVTSVSDDAMQDVASEKMRQGEAPSLEENVDKGTSHVMPLLDDRRKEEMEKDECLTIHGNSCAWPFTDKGQIYYDCAGKPGQKWCMTTANKKQRCQESPACENVNLVYRKASYWYDRFLDVVYTAGLRTTLPKHADTLDEHSLRYAAVMAGEFYFPQDDGTTEVADVLELQYGENEVAVRVRNMFQKILKKTKTSNGDRKRVTLGEFLTIVGKARNRKRKGLEEVAYGAYMGALYDSATSMMIGHDGSSDLGVKCFGVTYVLTQEFAYQGSDGDDKLGLMGDGLGLSGALKTAHDNSEQAWLETQEEGRVTRQAFKQYFMNKARLPPPNRVAPPVASAWVKEALETTARKVEQLSGKKLSGNGKHKASESIAWYDHVLDLLFTAGLRMMLPNTKDTLGKHCFQYAALMAGEFAFPATGRADVLGVRNKDSQIGKAAKDAFQAAKKGGRVTLGGFLKWKGGLYGKSWLEEISYGSYLAALYDAAVAMKAPTKSDLGRFTTKTDLGSKAFGVTWVLSQEFYFNDVGGSDSDMLGFQKEHPPQDQVLVPAYTQVNEDWDNVPKDFDGRVTRDAFKEYFVTKASQEGKFGSRHFGWKFLKKQR